MAKILLRRLEGLLTASFGAAVVVLALPQVCDRITAKTGRLYSGKISAKLFIYGSKAFKFQLAAQNFFRGFGRCLLLRRHFPGIYSGSQCRYHHQNR